MRCCSPTKPKRCTSATGSKLSPRAKPKQPGNSFRARGAPAHELVIRTLRAWNIRIDEALFLGGLDKGRFLKAFGADIFFDDQQGHCESASMHVATGHVPFGVVNQK